MGLLGNMLKAAGKEIKKAATRQLKKTVKAARKPRVKNVKTAPKRLKPKKLPKMKRRG